jgi:tetratricopeptide (TPR) repeat protein
MRRNEPILASLATALAMRSFRVATRMRLACIVLCLLPCSLPAQKILIPELDRLILRGIDEAGKQQYSRAAADFSEAIKRFPEHPAGYLNKAILLEVMSLDFETPVPQPEFNALLDKTQQLAELLLAADPVSAEAHYYRGMAHSYIAYYKFRDGENWVSGLRHGIKANDELALCLKADPSTYDAMTAAGTYKYWKSKRMSFLTWTPLVDDEREKGIRMLHTAANKAIYTSAQALNSLIWIYIEEENHDAAIRAAQRVLKQYPSNRLFLWGLASAAEKLGNRRMARDAYRQIVASVDDEVREPRYILIQARAKIARLSYELGDRTTARQECAWVLQHGEIDTSPFTSDGATRIRKRVDDMRDLREEMQ